MFAPTWAWCKRTPMYYIQSISIENPVTVLFRLDSWLDPPKTQNHPCITHAFPVHPPQITAIFLHPPKKNRWSHSIIHGTLSVYHQASRWDSTVPPNTTWLGENSGERTCGISKQLQYLGVSENSGTSKSSILIGFSIINHPFWGTPIFGNTHVLNSWTHEPKKKYIAQKLRKYLEKSGPQKSLQVFLFQNFPSDKKPRNEIFNSILSSSKVFSEEPKCLAGRVRRLEPTISRHWWLGGKYGGFQTMGNFNVFFFPMGVKPKGSLHRWDRWCIDI